MSSKKLENFDRDKPVRLACLNCYLLPWALTFKYGSRRSRIKQAERATRIGEFLSNYDVVALQEVWGR